MTKMLLAAVAAFALAHAAPAFACPDCKDCPNHKVAANDKDKKDAPAPAACKCATEAKAPCSCPEGKCHCAHEKKEAPKKS